MWAEGKYTSENDPLHRGKVPPSPSPLPPASPQAEALANPKPVTYETPTDPGQAGALSGWEKYNADLMAGNTAEAELAQQQNRDVTSGLAKEAGESAMARGATPGLFQQRQLAEGSRRAAGLSADLATRQFQRREAALTGQTGAAASAANTRVNLMSEQRASSLAEQQLELERAAAQQRIYDDQYQRMLEMMRLTGEYGDDFTGGGYAGGSAGLGATPGGRGGSSGLGSPGNRGGLG